MTNEQKADYLGQIAEMFNYDDDDPKAKIKWKQGRTAFKDFIQMLREEELQNHIEMCEGL